MADPIDDAARRLKRGHPSDWDKNLAAYRDAVLHAAAERQRAAIREFDLDDHWAVFYRSEDVEKLPDLIEPDKQEQP